MHSRALRRALQTAIPLLVAACTHSDPFITDIPDELGPAESALPRQLTYNLGDDRAPNVTGTAVAFSRRDPSFPSLGPCVAVLPTDGGTLSAQLCPPPPTPADTFVSSWLEPVVSPDASRLAFVWRRSARVSALAGWSYHLVVAAVDSPAVPLASVSLGRQLPGNRIVNTAVELAWVTPDVVRFLAAYDSVFKVKGGGAGRLTDTITVARALMDFTVTSGELAIIPGGDDVIAWAPASDGGMWIVPREDSLALVHLAADGVREPAGSWPLPVSDIAVVGSRLAGTTATDSLYWTDPVSGQGGRILLPGLAARLAAAVNGRVVVEVERRGGDVFGAPANLWLVALPEP